MFQPIFRGLIALLVFALTSAGCSNFEDDGGASPDPTPSMEPEPEPNPVPEPDDPMPEPIPDADPDVNPVVPCEPIGAEEVTEAAYDAYLLPPFQELVNELSYVQATVRKDGQDVTVVVGDDEIPAVFEESEELGHCVANPDVQVLKLCFFNADGTPAEPGALGAVFRPLGAALFGVVAHRRGADRPCTAQGHYDTSVMQSETDGDADVARFASDELLQYVSLFVVDDSATIFMGELPRPIEVDFDPSTGEFSGELEDDTLIFEEGGAAEWEIEMTVSGTFLEHETVDANVEATITLTITGDDFPDTVLTATLQGPRL